MRFSDKRINFRTPLQYHLCDDRAYFKICTHNVLCLLKSTSQVVAFGLAPVATTVDP